MSTCTYVSYVPLQFCILSRLDGQVDERCNARTCVPGSSGQDTAGYCTRSERVIHRVCTSRISFVVHLAQAVPNTYLVGVKMRVSLLAIATAAALACTAAAGCE
jgi:hypothetical protein